MPNGRTNGKEKLERTKKIKYAFKVFLCFLSNFPFPSVRPKNWALPSCSQSSPTHQKNALCRLLSVEKKPFKIPCGAMDFFHLI